MPKLNKEMAKKVSTAEGGSFELMEDGVYEARLKKVTVKEGPAGPYWNWEYELTEDGVSGRKQWNNTSLSDAALFKLHESFDAFGAEYDADTDDLCGQLVRLQIGHEVAKGGRNAGSVQNMIVKVLPHEPGEDEDAEGDGESPF